MFRFAFRFSLLVTGMLAAGQLFGQAIPGLEIAKNIRYDLNGGLLRWDVHEVLRQAPPLAGKKLMSCSITFEVPRMKCGGKSYPFTIEEAERVEGLLSMLLGRYIEESMHWFHNGGVSRTPLPGRIPAAGRLPGRRTAPHTGTLSAN